MRSTWGCAAAWGRRVLAAVASMSGFAAVAAAPEPIPAEVFFRPPTVQSIQLSPSGRRLAFTTEAKGRVGLFLFDLQDSEFRPSPVAYFTDVDVGSFDWVDDERLVFDVVDGQLGSGEDRRATPGLFSVRFDGSERRRLVDREAGPTGNRGYPGDPLPWYHRLLHVPVAPQQADATRTEEVVVGEMRIDRGELVGLRPLWLNVASGRTRQMDLFNPPGAAVRWWFNAQGSPRAVLTRYRGRDALHWYHQPQDGQQGRWVPLAQGDVFALPFWPTWVGAGDTLYVTERSGPAGELVVSPFDFAKGQPGTALVRVPGFDFDGELLGDREGRRLLGLRTSAESEQTLWLDPVHKALQQEVDRALPGRVNRITCRRCGAPDAVVLVQSWSDRHPGQLLLRLPAAADGQPRWRLIANQRPGIDPARMAHVEHERIRARDGRELPVWLTRPPASMAGRPLPTVVLVHGGPWRRQGHWRWEPMAQFLASRGYLVIEPEFRGSDGYGLAHLRAGDRQFGQAMQDDVSDALRWAQQRGLASDKACIAGGGYGGYSTLMGLIRTPEQFRCGSAWFAVTDLLLYVEGSWFVDDIITNTGRRHVLPERVGDPKKDREMLLANSPVEQARHIRAPLQLMWGAEDKVVPMAHGRRLRSALREAGVEPEWIVYDDEAHGLRRLENRADMARRLEAFLARHLH